MRVDRRRLLDALVIAKVDRVRDEEGDRLGRRTLELRRLLAHGLVRLDVGERAPVGQAVDREDDLGASGRGEDELLQEVRAASARASGDDDAR